MHSIPMFVRLSGGTAVMASILGVSMPAGMGFQAI